MSLFTICVCLLTSFLLISMGFYWLKRGFLYAAMKQQLWRDIVTWRVFGDAYPSPHMVTDIERSWCFLSAMGVIGGGIGTLLLGICMVVISLGTPAARGGSAPGDAMFFMATFYSSFFAGFGAGGIFAVWRMRQAATRRATYADVRQRHLSDYRSGLLRWIPLGVLVETVALSWFFASHLGTTLRLFQSGGLAVNVPQSLWMLSIIPATMVVVSLVAEFFMSRLACLPRLLITSDPTISQHADDMLRAMGIGMVQTYALIAVAYLGLLQGSLVVRSLWASGYWQLGNRPYHEISDMFFLVLLLTLVLGGCLALAHGRLGGTVSGWPWQIKHVKQPGVGQ